MVDSGSRIDALRSYWRRRFGAIPPFGRALRSAYTDRWLRLHALPSAKRYAESEAEFIEIMSRYETIFDDFLGAGTEIYVTFPSFYLEPGGEGHGVRNLLQTYAPERLMHVPESPSFFAVDVDVLAAPRTWERETLMPLLRAVADDEVESVSIISIGRDCVICPYDGGTDIIFSDYRARDAAQHRYWDWRSSRPDGL